jgi:ketosteroid isomerase-like protein
MADIISWLLLPLMLLRPGYQEPAKESRSAALLSLVDAEYAFARTAKEKGIQEAFLAFLADDAVLFRPGPVPGKQWLRAHPAAAGLLSWRPVMAEVSAARNFGFTTGPYEYRKQATDAAPASYGQFFTVWKKIGNEWKALVDFGVTTPAPDKPESGFAPVPLQAESPAESINLEIARAQLMRMEKDLAKAVAVSGRSALQARVASGARFLQTGRPLATEPKEITELLNEEKGARAWTPLQAEIANAGDLGFTYGTFEMRPADLPARSGHYLHMWQRKDGEWMLLVEAVEF